MQITQTYKEQRRRYPTREEVHQVKTKDRNSVQEKKYSHSENFSLEAVIIDAGESDYERSQDLHFSGNWKDRVKLGMHRVKVNIFDGMVAGAIITLGVALGTGIVTAWTVALQAPELERVKGLLIGIGVAGGALGGLGAGFADGLRVDTRALSVAAIAAIVTGAFIELQAIGTPAEGPRDIVVMASRAVIAATIAAFTVGIVTSVASGIQVRRNWVY